MRKLCRDFSKEGSLEIRYYNTNVPERLDFGISLSLFRVAQEALSNVTKYSRASHVQIRLQRKQSCVWMDIIDDGIGFETDRQAFNGIGLANMRDRMELVGGKITIKSAPMQGTRIRALVPTNSRAA
jgi:signal transduction histidine kinase